MFQEKKADFLMKLSEKFYGAVIAGALGSPAFYWLQNTKEEAPHGAFISFVILLLVGLIAAICLQISATRIYESIDKVQK